MVNRRDQADNALDGRIASVEGAMEAFERDNPNVAQAMKTVGLSIDEYERIIAMTAVDRTTTSGNTL